MSSKLRVLGGKGVHGVEPETPPEVLKKKKRAHPDKVALGQPFDKRHGVIHLGRGDDGTLFQYDARDVEHYGLGTHPSDYTEPVHSYLNSHGTYHPHAQHADPHASEGGRKPPSMAFLHRILGSGEGEPIRPEEDDEGGGGEGRGGMSPTPGLASPHDLHTGEDAINFFAQYGSHTPIKFVHLIRAHPLDSAVSFRPYDLIVVNPQDCGHDYFTMSAAGLVHIAAGEESECIPLNVWLRSSTLFNVLRNIRFYKYYLHTKAFNLWKSNVRFKLYCQQRRKLASRLFLAKDSFCVPLLELKRHIVEIAGVKLMDLSLKTYEPQQFVEAQANRRTEAAKQFEEIMERVSATLQKTCTDVSNLARQVDARDNVFDGIGGGGFKGHPARNRSIVAAKKEAAEKARMLQRAEQEAAMLPDFIRLIDYIAVESLIDLVISTSSEFLGELLKPRKAGLFETIVRFTDEGTSFAPTCEQLQTIIAAMFDAMITTVNTVNRVLYLKVFHERLAGVVRSGPVVASIIRASREFQSISREIDKKVEVDFLEAEDYVVAFESLRPIYEMNRNWNFDDFKRLEHTPTSLKEQLDLYAAWEREVEKMRARQPCGILEVESRKLRALLLPMIAEKMEAVKGLIRDVARTKCREQSAKYKARITKLAQRPLNLKDFAGQVQIMNELRAEDRVLVKNTQLVEMLYALLNQYKVSIPTEDMVGLEDLKNLQQQYADETEAFKTFKDERLPEMTQQLDINIARLNDQLVQMKQGLEENVFVDAHYFEDPSPILAELDLLQEKLASLANMARTYAEYQDLFGIETYSNKNLVKAQEVFDRQQTLWKMIARWNDQTEHWMGEDFTKVDVEEMNKEVQTYFKDAYALNKKMLNEVTSKLKDAVSDLKAKMNTIVELGSPAMRPRHWERLFKVLNQAWFPDLKFSLNDLINYGVLKIPEFISETSAAAAGEAGLEASLDKIASGWDTAVFTVLHHRDQPDVFILGGLDEVFTMLEDNQVALQTMMGSRFISGVQSSVQTWEKKLGLLSETLDEWVTAQRNWMYLETIFCAEDIQKQLPLEAQKFSTVDKFWKSTMRRTHENPKVVSCIDEGPVLLHHLQTSNVALEEVQKSLEDYLETKRMAFPRFYFLSNDELLGILSQTRDSHAVQPHMQKAFDAIKRLRFGDGQQQHAHDILGFEDPGGEYVEFSQTRRAEGAVETWLTSVEAGMREALYDNCKAAVKAYPPHGEEAINRAAWMWAYPAQVVIVVDQIFWTHGLGSSITSMESGDNPNATVDFLEFSLKQIDAMVALVRSNLTRQQRTLLGALITIDVHARDVVRVIVQKRVSSVIDFEWTKQLRYYWEAEVDNVVARQTNTRFVYGFEYLGNGPRLVITPLTDICYMTLTGALHMRLGGAPAGPAGTGKTETTKDLAKALAVYCVVFNCSDGLDYKIMGRFFSGLAQQGAWACFDEFNRIDIEVLSVIAQQVLCIQQAILVSAKTFEFEGKVIPLNPMNPGFFITMNPGYAGRTELPDNLKALFRPVAMMVPDYRLIAEIVLFSEGFANALPLSNKMAQLYSLSSEQLSKQDHYDFGMRAVKSVLVAAGQLKRKEPETNEDLLLIRAMRDSNVPKFLQQDLPLFQGIISDLFPGVVVPYVDYGVLQRAIEDELDKDSLQRSANFITKIIQVHETQLVRHGMMVVGEAGSGKTMNVNILARALSKLHAEGVLDRDGFYKTVDRLILNPKSITAGELYGEFNLLTNEWTDGLVPKLVRQCVQSVTEGSDNRKWVIFDGPVDAVWIENMNTVLDDNKTLCLANSERIKLPTTLHMMFEVQDLKVASPATVSRCGMVYMEQVHIGMLSLVRTWGATTMKTVMPDSHAQELIRLMCEHVEGGVAYVREFCRQKITAPVHNLVQSMLNLLTALFDPKRGFNAQHPYMSKIVRLSFLWAFVWSIGANIHDQSRPVFQEWMRNKFASLVDGEDEAFLSDVYGYTLDMDKACFVSWLTLLQDFTYNKNVPYFNLLVPTAETTKYGFFLNKLMRAGCNVLYTGDTGVGKSVVVQSFLDSCTGGEQPFVSYTMGYSAQTKPKNLKDVLESKLEKKRKNLLGPPAGKQMLFFIDDLNMPALEVYGAQPPNELLRQIIDSGGFYDTQKHFFKYIKDVVFASCCAPPGGGRNEVSPRLLRHFSMVWLTNLSTESMTRIFSAILGGFLNAEMPLLAQYAEPLVKASVDIYERVEAELLPTPAKSHYTFNLRDLSKVFQGMLMTKSAFTASQDDLIKVWCHEECRVFRDRLINEADRDYFNGLIKEMLAKHMGAEMEVDAFKDLLYGDYLSRESKVYRQVTNPQAVNELLMEFLEEYNITFPSQMHLVFFNDAVHHISRISRVLRQPRGNALLVGVGGSGRQSLTRLAAFMADYKCRSIEIKRGYGVNEFHEDLKAVLMTAGAENVPTVFLFSDTQIVSESFLEDINNILNSGEVPNLYAPDEIEKIVGMVRPLAKAAGKVDTREVILQHYIQLVRENLHVVLAMSPIGAGFRNRCRMFPSLVNCCTIDWFDKWPQDALSSVAHRLLNDRADLGLSAHIAPLCQVAVSIHRAVQKNTEKFYRELHRHNYTTPTSYLELIRLYLDLLGKQRDAVSGNEARYKGGLQKLAETEKMVNELQHKLTEMKPFLETAAKETAELLVKVEADQKEAEIQQGIVQGDVAEANKVAAEVQAIKDDCQADLNEAMPAYKASIKALDSLDKKSIQEMKAFNNPPEMVAVCIEAVCILLGTKPSWDEGKKLLSAMNFMERLKDYDKDNIPKASIKALQKYMQNPKFVPEEVKKVSEAATCLCMWVRAMVTYDRVAKNIEPKKERLAQAEAQLAKVNEQLNTKKAALQEVLDRVAAVKAILQATMDKKAELEAKALKTQQQLERAEKLIGGLGGEKIRWRAAADKLALDLVNLIGNMMLSAGVVAYLGPFTAEYRREMINQWISLCKDVQIPVDAAFNLENTLGSPVVIRQWQISGLPADEFSTENGIVTTMGRRWPLMIDPQAQANRWIRNTYADKNLQVIKLTEKDFLRTLENGIRYGAPVLLENVGEELDPSLEPVLLKQVFRRGGQSLLRLGDTDVPYSDEFQFFITTKLANPHYMPEVCIKVTIINFTVTMTGLEDQLLVDVIKNERPDLEEKKDELVVSIAADQKALKDIENKILQMLASASGNILDDEELIETLAQSKVTSTAINSRLTEAEQTTKLINQTRESYRVVATRGSVIYFVIAGLALVDPMYQYSLQFYKSLFNVRLKKSEKHDDVSKRLEILVDDVTAFMYTNVCRGLFEKDKLLYAFLIISSIHRHADAVSDKEWLCYLLGPGTADQNVLKKHPPPPKTATWLHQGKVWNDVVMLEETLGSTFEGLAKDMTTNHIKWSMIANSPTPHNEEPPGMWNKKLTTFQKLLLLRVLREEKLVFATRRYVKLELGEAFAMSPPFDLEAAYQDSTPITPLIFVLSPGADINDYLLELAKSKGKLATNGLKIISLGQGQGPIAERLMQQGRLAGDWVCLQNCHLAASWLPRLEQNLEQATAAADAIHPEFRLWLTSMPSPKFPVPILQTGIKITNEPPKGLKANLLRTFLDMKDEEYESCSRPRTFKKLLFAVAFFNALILERRKFGAVGWNIPYEWMNSDLKAAIMQVRMYVEEQEQIPWETLNVMVSEITYGGRVTDKQDKRAISSIMRKFFDPGVLDDEYKFSESGLYFAPPEGPLESVREYVRSLPMEDPPDTFGLHANADIAFQQKETNQLLETIMATGGGGGEGSGGGGGANADQQVAELAQSIAKRMPAAFDMRKAHESTFKKVHGTMNSLGVFLGQELVRFNGLIEVMKATLDDLQRAIKGTIVMSGPLENMYNCFLFNRVPPAWENAGYPCLKPLGSWIEDFFARIAFMQEWLTSGPRPSYWLSGFFFPQGFMTAVKQTYSRQYRIAIDTLIVDCEMMPFDVSGIRNTPKDGVYVHGLFMEGARFDRRQMIIEESLPGVLCDVMPCIWFKPRRTAEDDGQRKGFYSCPVYKTSRRAGTLSTTGHSTNFVVALDVPTKKEPDHWIRRGCAMLCMLDT